jgi:hypothetical protein
VTEEASKTELGDADGVEPRVDAYNSDGVDLTLVRAMLRKTPTQRLRAVQDVIDLLAGVTRGGPR